VGGTITSTSTATSSLAGNLNVAGAIHGGFVYAGDLFFSNNFSFAEAPLNGTTQGLLLRNQNGKDMMTVDENGNLSTVGDVCFKGKQCFGLSIDELTNDITALASSTSNSLFSAQATTTASLSELTVSLGDTNRALSTLRVRLDLLASSTPNMEMIATTTAETLSKSDSFIGKILDAIIAKLTDFGLTISRTFTRVTSLFVGTIQVEDKLCADDVCINKDQLKALLVQAGGVKAATTTVSVATTTPAASPSATSTSPASVVTPAATSTPAAPVTAPVASPTPAAAIVTPSPTVETMPIAASTSTPSISSEPTASTTPAVSPSSAANGTLEASPTPAISPTPTSTPTGSGGSGGGAEPTSAVTTPTPEVSPTVTAAPANVEPSVSSTPSEPMPAP
jgi:hypothetical protein